MEQLPRYAQLTTVEYEKVVERFKQLQAKIERLKEVLDAISKMNFNTGRSDLLGQRIREMIRQVNHPTEPCPNCNGTGEVPSHWTDCGSCESFNNTTLGGGRCDKKARKGLFAESSERCSLFKYRVPMVKCNACDGKPFIKKQALNQKEK